MSDILHNDSDSFRYHTGSLMVVYVKQNCFLVTRYTLVKKYTTLIMTNDIPKVLSSILNDLNIALQNNINIQLVW